MGAGWNGACCSGGSGRNGNSGSGVAAADEEATTAPIASAAKPIAVRRDFSLK